MIAQLLQRADMETYNLATMSSLGKNKEGLKHVTGQSLVLDHLLQGSILSAESMSNCQQTYMHYIRKEKEFFWCPVKLLITDDDVQYNVHWYS